MTSPAATNVAEDGVRAAIRGMTSIELHWKLSFDSTSLREDRGPDVVPGFRRLGKPCFWPPTFPKAAHCQHVPEQGSLLH